MLGKGSRNSGTVGNLRPDEKPTFSGTYPARNSELSAVDYENDVIALLYESTLKFQTIRKTGDLVNRPRWVITLHFTPLYSQYLRPISTEYESTYTFVINVAERVHVKCFASYFAVVDPLLIEKK